MIIFNLTDQIQPGRSFAPQTIKVDGVSIEPGRKAEVASANLARLSGMIYGGRIAVDTLPDWYVRVRRYRRRQISEKSAVDAPKDRRAQEGVGNSKIPRSKSKAKRGKK
jgi:hypothetical protein